MELIQILFMLLSILVVLLFALIIIYIMLVLKNRSDSRETQNIVNETNKTKTKAQKKLASADKKSIYDFMEFDEIQDNMIIRKNRSQYVMVVKCKGVNYDLMSEEEKVSVESGFVQFLNTLRFPIQLYIQTTSLNLRDIIEDYQSRLKNMQRDIRKIDEKIYLAKSKGETSKISKLEFEKRRMENVYEYSADISEYIAKMSMNKNILQQKTYLIISYYTAETETNENLSKEEIDNLCFSELYTRTQTAIRSLGASGVIGKILNSEELAELLFAAYNRDESEVMQLSKALDAEYDALYSSGKDVLLKKQEVLEDVIEREAVKLVTDSIKNASEEIEKEKRIKEKAIDIVEEYRNQMDEEIYDKTKKRIVEDKTTVKKRGRKPKVQNI